MTIQDLKEENACFSTTKELLISNEYTERGALVSDVSTSLASQGYEISSEEISLKIDELLGGVFYLSSYYFPGDTSINFVFSNDNIDKMLIENPDFSEYVQEHNIIVKEVSNIERGVYLSFILPQHLEIFEKYGPLYFDKDNIIQFRDDYDWKYVTDRRYLISKRALVDLYKTPSNAEWISQKSYVDYIKGNYIFLYEHTPYTTAQRNILISAGAELEED